MRVIFMGTPEFSVGTLEALIEAGHEAVLVVTQPDKPKGRGGKMQYTPVKEAALKHGIPVFQPRKVREPECVEELRRYGADIIVVIAFGQILPKEILEMTPYGCVNVHASLLPKYRGAAPIQRAILNGDAVTGVTIMRMDEGLDTGDMIAKREVAIAPEDTGGTLFNKLAEAGARLCAETIPAIADRTAVYTPQDDAEATKVGQISKQDGWIDFHRPAGAIECQVRGLNPWPSAYTTFNGKTLKIWSAGIREGGGAPAGTVVFLEKDCFGVQTGDGVVVGREVQLEGKKRMDAGAFLRGNALEVGTLLG